MVIDMELISDAAIVTGGASGIGFGTAELFMELGTSVVLADIADDLDEAAADLNDRFDGARAVPVECDVTDEATVEATVATAADELGDVGILVNCAGAVDGLDRTWELGADEWRNTVDICLTGTFLTNKHVVGHMLDNDVEGSVINISSINSEDATDGVSHYSAAKAGVVQLTKTVAAEAGRYGIRANAIAPGVTRTAMSEGGFLDGRMAEEFLAHTPMGRIADPVDQARVAAFLASDYAGWVTGQNIFVDGGSHIRGLHSYWDVLNEADEE